MSKVFWRWCSCSSNKFSSDNQENEIFCLPSGGVTCLKFAWYLPTSMIELEFNKWQCQWWKVGGHKLAQCWPPAIWVILSWLQLNLNASRKSQYLCQPADMRSCDVRDTHLKMEPQNKMAHFKRCVCFFYFFVCVALLEFLIRYQDSNLLWDFLKSSHAALYGTLCPPHQSWRSICFKACCFPTFSDDKGWQDRLLRAFIGSIRHFKQRISCHAPVFVPIGSTPRFARAFFVATQRRCRGFRFT